ncbi:MATE family efflux transporter [Bacillus sp. YC2]|uniref:MATE family efflux transporter n=1 Tax=Bacillus sp. YC2 TaxID=2861287 RepID=UPI001CA685A6|nr:MATE family efflux transporter [Bacillus sp. YC2]MBY8914863.1 MATE family efflux transporter [Bacillus sp. YC2]
MNTASVKMTNTQPFPLFLSYLIPSCIGMFLMAVNILVDGLFVSHGVGPEALAAVNISVPVYSVIFSISLGIGIGGAALYSIALGEGKPQKGRHIFTHSLVLALVIIGTFAAVSFFHAEWIAEALGASGGILPLAADYLTILLGFSLFYVIENMLSIFIRNDGNPNLAMTGLVITSVFNMILNYIFIFKMDMGIKGAAYATAFATIIGLLVLLTHFLRKNSVLRIIRFKPDWKTIYAILKTGLPSFIIEGSTAIMTVCCNLSFLHFAGAAGITAFAIINNLHAVILVIFIAIGSALQPIVSFHYGMHMNGRLRRFLRLGIGTGLVFGVFFWVMSLFFGDVLIRIFGDMPNDVSDYTRKGMALYFIGYVFLGMNMVYAEYYQAIKKIRLSSVIILARCLILFIPLLFTLPMLFGSMAIWLAFPLSEGLTALFIIVGRFKWKGFSPVTEKAREENLYEY